MMKIIFDSEENKRLYENEAVAMAGAFYTDMAFFCTAESVADDPDRDCGVEELFCTIDESHVQAAIGESLVSLEYGSERVRHAFKRALYLALAEHLGRELPWGCLTGVRPVRLMSGKLNAGMSEDEALAWFTDQYYVSRAKAGLVMEIALRQRGILRDIRQNDFCLYVGIPFCPTTCLYCSFTSYPIQGYKKLVKPYLEALKKEIRECASIFDRPPVCVYIGGGTPSALDAGDIDDLLSQLEDAFQISKAREITFEAGRPDSITEEKLEVLKRHGVDRISINPQTMNDDTLALIGRHHKAEDVWKAFFLARKMGFQDINMDLILGLPGEGEPELKHTLDEIRELEPDSLTIHSLAIKRGSKLYELILEREAEKQRAALRAPSGESQRPDGEKKEIRQNGDGAATGSITRGMTELISKTVEALGMKPYYLYRQKRITDNFENTGYGSEGKYCLYNVATMEETNSILALGAGSISKAVHAPGGEIWRKESPGGTSKAGNDMPPDGGGCRIERCENVKEIKEYIDRIDEMIERKLTLFLGDSHKNS